MAIKYLSGNRLQGTTAERTALNLASPPATSWKELDRVTLGSSGDTLDTSTFTAKDNIMFQFHILRPSSGDQNIRIRFNGDSGSNYSERYSLNGGTDATATSQANIALHSGVVNENFGCFTFVNTASKEKLCTGDVVGSNTDGSGSSPSRREQIFKWANTSDQVTRIEIVNTSSGDFEAGSELVVLGCDNDEADSGSNYWQELASVSTSSSGAVLSSGTITAKKYLMFEAYMVGSAAQPRSVLRFNDDGVTTTYSDRYQTNGGSDGSTQAHEFIHISESDQEYGSLISGFIINKSDKEKLLISENTNALSAGNAPNRFEAVGKWANTSAQITSIQLRTHANTFSYASLKIWGAD